MSNVPGTGLPGLSLRGRWGNGRVFSTPALPVPWPLSGVSPALSALCLLVASWWSPPRSPGGGVLAPAVPGGGGSLSLPRPLGGPLASCLCWGGGLVSSCSALSVAPLSALWPGGGSRSPFSPPLLGCASPSPVVLARRTPRHTGLRPGVRPVGQAQQPVIVAGGGQTKQAALQFFDLNTPFK